MRGLILLVSFLVLLNGIVAASRAHVAGSELDVAVGCHHGQTDRAKVAMEHVGNVGDTGNQHSDAMPGKFCDGIACTVGFFWPEQASVPVPANSGPSAVLVGFLVLRGISVPPLFDPPRHFG